MMPASQRPTFVPVPLYLVERHSPRLKVKSLIVAQLALVQASRNLAAGGAEIRYLRSIFVPRTCHSFCLFEAPGAELVRQLNDAASFAFSCIEEALELPAPAPDHPRRTREGR
jgi:hypothetical protein